MILQMETKFWREKKMLKIDKIQRINKIILNRKEEIRNGIDTIKKIEIKIVLEKKRKKNDVCDLW